MGLYCVAAGSEQLMTVDLSFIWYIHITFLAHTESQANGQWAVLFASHAPSLTFIPRPPCIVMVIAAAHCLSLVSTKCQPRQASSLTQLYSTIWLLRCQFRNRFIHRQSVTRIATRLIRQHDWWKFYLVHLKHGLGKVRWSSATAVLRNLYLSDIIFTLVLQGWSGPVFVFNHDDVTCHSFNALHSYVTWMLFTTSL